jgi:hypothetical protein
VSSSTKAAIAVILAAMVVTTSFQIAATAFSDPGQENRAEKHLL